MRKKRPNILNRITIYPTYKGTRTAGDSYEWTFSDSEPPLYLNKRVLREEVDKSATPVQIGEYFTGKQVRAILAHEYPHSKDIKLWIESVKTLYGKVSEGMKKKASVMYEDGLYTLEEVRELKRMKGVGVKEQIVERQIVKRRVNITQEMKDYLNKQSKRELLYSLEEFRKKFNLNKIDAQDLLIAYLYGDEEIEKLNKKDRERQEAYSYSPTRLRDAIYSFNAEKFKQQVDELGGQFEEEETEILLKEMFSYTDKEVEEYKKEWEELLTDK